MNRYIKKAAIIITIVFALTGCGTANTAAGNASGQNREAQTQTAQTAVNNQNRPQFETADLMGEVSAILGNEITIKVISMPAIGQGRRGGQGWNGASPDGQTSQGAIGRTSQGAIGRRQAPANNPGQGTGSNPGDGQQPQRNVQYTGETKVLTITDSINIAKTVRGDGGIASQAIQVSDIKVGDILQVYYSDKAKETISKITLGSGMGMGGGRPQGKLPDNAPKS